MRPLIIAESANPTFVSVPLVGWSHSTAIQRATGGHIVTQIRNRQDFIDAGLEEGKDFTAIDSEKVAGRLYRLNTRLRKLGLGWTTTAAISSISYYYFEKLAAKHFENQLRNGEFDLVHRVTPLSPTSSSPSFSKVCKKHNIPLIVGPLNGGVPWPKGYDHIRRAEGEWLSYIRPIYKIMPGSRKTLNTASAIITGSGATRSQINAKHHHKCVYIPENAVDPERFEVHSAPRNNPVPQAAFIGRLVPYKGAEILVRAATKLAKEKKIKVHIFGDGPQMPELKQLVTDNKLQDDIILHGWVDHSDLQNHLRSMDIFAFPSIREFGGGVVLEAMACGVIPVIVDYAGPGELVDKDTGFKIPIGSPDELVTAYEKILEQITDNYDALEPMRQTCVQRVKDHFTWDAKAQKTLRVYEWACGNRNTNPELDDDFSTMAPPAE